MNKQRTFLVGALAVGAVVVFLVVTGMRDAMVYYHTPGELLTRVEEDPSFRSVGVKVGGQVESGSVSFDGRTLDLRFTVLDSADPFASFPVHYRGPLPDTFEEGREVVLDGRLNDEGVFEATTLLTKCGSRYEAVEEDLRRDGENGAGHEYGAGSLEAAPGGTAR